MQCLNIKLTYRCSNRCSFCFSSYLASKNTPIASAVETITKGFSRGCRELVISGGEPTLEPDLFLQTLKTAEHLGYEKYIIQTNGFGLSNRQSQLVEFLKSFSQNNSVSVSFSVHGSNAVTHDEMCSTKGSFDKLLEALHAISETNCEIYTNTVVSTLNIKKLDEIITLVVPYNPRIVQFAMMHLASPSPLSTKLIETACAVKALKDCLPTSILRTEGIPFCIMHGLEQCVGESYWPNRLDVLTSSNKYLENFKQINYGMRWKSKRCSRCVMNEICPGIWKEHAQEFEESQIRPIE